MSDPAHGTVRAQQVDELSSLVAREMLYRFFGLAFRGPHEPIWREGIRSLDASLLAEAARIVAETRGSDRDVAFVDEVVEACRILIESGVESIQAEYDRIFGLLVPRECPPYETEYLRAADAFQRAQVMADVAGFYRAFGLKPSRRSPERVDHVSLMCEFMAILLMKERAAVCGDRGEEAAVCRDAARKFLAEHLAWWIPAFTTGLEKKAQGGLYAVLARALRRWIEIERANLGVAGPDSMPRPELIERPEEAGGCFSCPLAG